MNSIVDQLLAAVGLVAREATELAKKLIIRVLWIGPAEATALLAANEDNRKLRPGRVRFYAETMRQGGWMLTHQGIAFSETGRGLDLQHRLEAIRLSGVTVPMLVIEGLPDSAFAAIDQHERRTMADALRKERSVVEVARLILALVGGTDSNNPTVLAVGETSGEIVEDHAALMDACGTRSAIYTSVPMRLAAIMLMRECPALREQVLHAYRALALQRTEVYSPAMHAFARQVRSGVVSTQLLTNRRDLLLRGLIVLDPRRSQVSKIQIKDGANDLLATRVAALFSVS